MFFGPGREFRCLAVTLTRDTGTVTVTWKTECSNSETRGFLRYFPWADLLWVRRLRGYFQRSFDTVSQCHMSGQATRPRSGPHWNFSGGVSSVD